MRDRDASERRSPRCSNGESRGDHPDRERGARGHQIAGRHGDDFKAVTRLTPRVDAVDVFWKLQEREVKPPDMRVWCSSMFRLS
jgi:hypothetical protein